MDNPDVVISLPWAPSMNTYWRHVPIKGKPRTLISKKGREFKSAVKQLCAIVGRDAITESVAVEILAYPPDKRKRDLDNLLKPILDALTEGGIWGDDSQVDDLRIIRKDIRKTGEIVVMVKAIGKTYE